MEDDDMALNDALQRLIASANLSDADKAKVEEAFSIESVGRVVGEGVMLRSDYSRKQDELKLERDKADLAIRDAEALKTKLTADWNKANAEYMAMQDSMTATQAEKDAALTRAQTAEGKLTDAERRATIDQTKLLTKEEFEAKQREFAHGQAAYFSDVDDVRDQVQTLAGKRLSVRTILAESGKAGKTPTEWAEETYKLGELQRAADTKAQTERDEQLRQEGRQAAISEMSNPSTRHLQASKDPFYVPKGGDGADAAPKQPWDSTETPAHEQKLLEELQAASAG